MKPIFQYLIVFAHVLTFAFVSSAWGDEVLTGNIDDSPRWGSGWLVLDGPRDFPNGSRLRLHIGGEANKIKVRLLPKGRDSNTRAGVLPGVFKVPDERIVEIGIDAKRRNIVQISVHGGPNPWGKYPLGGGNGPATLEQAVLVLPE